MQCVSFQIYKIDKINMLQVTICISIKTKYFKNKVRYEEIVKVSIYNFESSFKWYSSFEN